jgi:hypothetical protein
MVPLPLSDQLAAMSVDVDMDGGVIHEVTARHGRSAQPDSQQVMAVLAAVLEVLRGEGMMCSPTTMFAAVMSALDKPEMQQSEQVRAPRFGAAPPLRRPETVPRVLRCVTPDQG